ncbi:MAG: beta-eliminating lyase-related protein [Caldilineaceae bacterium]
MFSYADGCTMSAKKDGMANIGGFLAMNDDDLAMRCKNMEILGEGFTTAAWRATTWRPSPWGWKRLEEDYLHYRIRSVEARASAWTGWDPVRQAHRRPLYIDAKAMLPHIPWNEYPAWALALALYVEGGVRGGDRLGHVRQAAGRQRAAQRHGTGAAGLSPPGLHPEPHRLRGRSAGVRQHAQRDAARRAHGLRAAGVAAFYGAVCHAGRDRVLGW